MNDVQILKFTPWSGPAFQLSCMIRGSASTFLIIILMCVACFVLENQFQLSPGVKPWLGGDNRSGRLNTWGGADWPPGLAATLALLPG